MSIIFNCFLVTMIMVDQSSDQDTIATDSLILAVEELKNPRKKINMLTNLVRSNHKSRPEFAKKYAQKLLQLSQMSGTPEEIGDAYWYLARIDRYMFQYDKAFENYLRSMKYYKECKVQHKLARIYNEIGLIFFKTEEYESAIEYFSRALAIYKNESIDTSSITLYYNLGIGYRALNQFEKALDYHEKALEIAINVGNRRTINNIYNKIGTIHYYAANYENARAYYQKSIEFLDGEDRRKNLGMAYNNIGETYLETGDLLQAKSYFEKSLKIKLKINDKNLTASTLINLGKLALVEHKPDSAIIFLERTLSLIDSTVINDNLRDASSLLVRAYESKKNPSEEDYKRILELNRAYITRIHKANTNNNQKLFDLMLVNDTMEEEAQYLQQKTKTIQNRTLWIMAIAAMVVLVLLILLYHRERRFEILIQRMWEDIKDV